MLVLPAVPLWFQPLPLVAPLSPPFNVSCVSRAIYMQTWDVRECEARIQAHVIAYALPRRSPRLARRLE